MPRNHSNKEKKSIISQVRIFKDIRVADIDAMSLCIPEEEDFEFNISGAEDAPEAKSHGSGAAGAVGLPFGLESLRAASTRPKKSGGSGKGKGQGQEKMGVSQKDEAAAADIDMGNVGDEDQPDEEHSGVSGGDPMSCLLSPAAGQELDAALRLERQQEQQEQQDEVAPSEPASSSRAPARPLPGRRVAGATQREESNVLPFQASLGVVGVARVQRGRVVCVHCDQQIQKGGLRLQYAVKANKPSRSLHPGCVFQIPEELVEPSLRFLTTAKEAAVSPEEREACEEACNVLESRL